jgi:hypothetical protein
MPEASFRGKRANSNVNFALGDAWWHFRRGVNTLFRNPSSLNTKNPTEDESFSKRIYQKFN